MRKQGGEVQSWERRSQLLGSHGVVTRAPPRAQGPVCWGRCWPKAAQALEAAMVGGQQDPAPGLLPDSGPLRVLVSLPEPGALMGRSLASE